MSSPSWQTLGRLFALALLWLVSAPSRAAGDDAPIACPQCKEWNQAQRPFQVFGNTWYVGPRGLASVLITGPEGHILLDGALPQSAKVIERNLRALGFDLRDVKLILSSHGHFDHAGGIAALQRASGATVVASASTAQVLRDGVIGRDDPQFDAKSNTRFPQVERVQVIGDGETISVGSLQITAHLTPGHTAGSTSYSWRSCEGERCLDVVYADSLSAVSSDGFRFSGDASHPDLSASFRASVAKIAALKCDVVLSVHPDFTDTFEKLAAKTSTTNPFVAADGCRRYASGLGEKLEARLVKEKAAAATGAPR